MASSNKPDMIPIGVVDMFVVPLKENLSATSINIGKLSENIEELSTDIVNKISEHDKEITKKIEDFRNCIFTKNKENMEYFRERNKEVDIIFNKYTTLLNGLSKSNDEYDTVIDEFKKSLDDLKNKVKTMITVVLVGFALFTAVYAIVLGIVNVTVERSVKNIIESRGPSNKQGTIQYWIDEKGNKQYIYVEEEKHNAIK